MVIVNAFSFFLLFAVVGLTLSQRDENQRESGEEEDSTEGGESEEDKRFFWFRPNYNAFLRRRSDFCRTRRHERGRCVPLSWCPSLAEQESNEHRVSFLLLQDNTCSHIDRNYVCCPHQHHHHRETTTPNSRWTTRPWLGSDWTSSQADSWSWPKPTEKEPTPVWGTPKTTSSWITSTSTTVSPDAEDNIFLHPNRVLLPENECGAAVTTGDKIIGGDETGLDEFPWMALLRYRLPNGRVRELCGGSLITSRYVITAAHCIQPPEPRGIRLIQVRLGEHDTRTTKDCQNKMCNDEVLDVDIENITVHREYKTNDVSQHNDIALLRLTRPVRTTNFISPICLPLDDLLTKEYERQKLTVAGWGRTSNSPAADMNPVKLKVAVPVINLNDCSQQYSRSKVRLRKSQLCAGGEKNKDSCQGDSGGPLMTEELVGAQLRWYLTGIVSIGPKMCGMEKAAAVYTRVSEYMTWILDNIKD